MDHSPGFLKLVQDAQPRVQEITVAEAKRILADNPHAVLMDVREDHEWEKGHAHQAVHLGKGILERDIEKNYPDVNAEIIMYCGGGYRSILTADAAQKIGYRKIYSLIGGYKGLVSSGWKISTEG